MSLRDALKAPGRDAEKQSSGTAGSGTQLLEKLFPAKPKPPPPGVPTKQQVKLSEHMQTKLKELEDEIAKYRALNAELTKLKVQRCCSVKTQNFTCLLPLKQILLLEFLLLNKLLYHNLQLGLCNGWPLIEFVTPSRAASLSLRDANS